MIRRSEKFDNKRRRFAAKALSLAYQKGGHSHQGGLPCVVSAAWQDQECCSWSLASALAISRPLAVRAGLQRRARSTRRSNIPASAELLAAATCESPTLLRRGEGRCRRMPSRRRERHVERPEKHRGRENAGERLLGGRSARQPHQRDRPQEDRDGVSDAN